MPNPKENDLPAWLDYIAEQHTKSIDLGLERIKQVATKLHCHEFNCPVITIAGTNGKGTTVAAIEAIAKAAGIKCGSYTSPHLNSYNERVRINNKNISDEALCEAFSLVEQARGDTPLTYFEFGTLAALHLLNQADIQLVVLEIGLGGRLDAVNIVDSDIAIITNIHLDHTEWLGPDRESIGREKVAISRPGKPLIYGESSIPYSIVKYAEANGVPFYHYGHDFHSTPHGKTWQWHNDVGTYNDLNIANLSLSNISCAIQAMQLLIKTNLSSQIVKQAINNLSLPGRIQILPGEPSIVLDVAHNPHSIAKLANYLTEQPVAGENIAVIGMLKDKAIAESLCILEPYITQWHTASLNQERGADYHTLNEHLQSIGRSSKSSHETVQAALAQAKAQAKPQDRIIVFGSFHTVAEAMME